MMQSRVHIVHNICGMDGGGGCQWLAGLVTRVCLQKGEIMFGWSDNSGGIMVGLLCVEQNVVGSNLALCFNFFFHMSKFFQVLIGSLYS